MSILVTGATGTVGSGILRLLSQKGVALRALTRDPAKAALPAGVTPVKGDMLDVAAMRAAMEGTTTLFLLNAVSDTELTQAMLTLNLAREAGVRRVVYLSVFNAESYSNVPHFASKRAIERMIADLGITASILRPNCFMQNDAAFFRAPLTGAGIYPFPLGEKGVSMVDTGDLSAVAAHEILRRETAGGDLPTEVINVAGPEALTGPGIAAIWSDVMGKPVRWAGADTRGFEAQLAQHAPGWMAMDMRLMLDRFCADGMIGSDADVATMRRILGRSPRSYADFAAATLAGWQG